MFETLKARIRGMHRSLTIWFNTTVGTIIVLLPVAESSFPSLQDYVPHNVYQWGMGIVIAANIALRFHTVTDLANKGKSDVSNSSGT